MDGYKTTSVLRCWLQQLTSISNFYLFRQDQKFLLEWCRTLPVCVNQQHGKGWSCHPDIWCALFLVTSFSVCTGKNEQNILRDKTSDRPTSASSRSSNNSEIQRWRQIFFNQNCRGRPRVVGCRNPTTRVQGPVDNWAPGQSDLPLTSMVLRDNIEVM